MRVCKVFLHLLSIFVVLVPFSVSAVEFKQVDFERLLNNHPLMKNYDSETGRFKNTPSEIIPVTLIEQRISSLTTQINACKKKKSGLVATAMQPGEDHDENLIWDKIGKLDQEIATLQKQCGAETTLLEQKGIPGFETLFKVVTGLTIDVVDGSSAPNRLLINKLPRFPAEPPLLSGFDLRHFYYQPDSQHLEKYLQQAGLIGLLFSKTDCSIIYNRNGAAQGNE